MHIIPQSWSHLHILIGVFPFIGFAVGIAFYIAGLRTNNGGTRKACLTLFALLGLLAIPIYISGAGAMAAAASNARFSKEMLATHYLWGLAAVAVLLLAGLIPGIEVWRARQSRRPAGDPLRLVLPLAGVAFVLSAAAAEFGLPINHREFELGVAIPDISTPQIWSHAHVILNHIPTAGFVFALAFFITALLTNNNGMKRGSLILLVICSVMGVPTYVAGTAAMWALTQPGVPDISKAVINSHRDMALWTLFGMAFTGAAAWIELWRSRSTGSLSRSALNLVLLFAVVTLGLMTETGHRGGLINHPEIRTAADILPTATDAGISMRLETAMKEMIWFVPWQTVHFFGYCLIFGAAAVVTLRVLGFWKSLSFPAVHRILVLGFFGVVMNVISGMLMLFADSYRYVVSDTAFAPKIALIAIGAVAALYFSASDRMWNVGAGDNAPASAKWVAAVVLLAWTGVIVCGRMLPYL